jgi:cysteine desulfuration protein SufE
MTEPETLDEAKRNIVDEFTFLGDWTLRYEHIIDLGRGLGDLPDELRRDSHLVPGCQSRVWFHAGRDADGLIHFRADSDAMIVRGLIALLLRIYSGRRADEILATSPEFFEILELGSHLSGSRANGLHAMVKRIQAFAAAYDDTERAAEVDPAEPS